MEQSPNLDTIGAGLTRVATDVTTMDMLQAFDEVLEESGMYAYKNWFDGELCVGPEISRFWFTTTWMWPHKMMPDPDAGLRLIKKGAKVYMYEDVLEEPTRVMGPNSIDSLTKKAKLINHAVWCVKIEMPRELVDGKLEDIIDLEDTIEIDSSVAEEAFDKNDDDQMAEDAIDDEAPLDGGFGDEDFEDEEF